MANTKPTGTGKQKTRTRPGGGPPPKKARKVVASPTSVVPVPAGNDSSEQVIAQEGGGGGAEIVELQVGPLQGEEQEVGANKDARSNFEVSQEKQRSIVPVSTKVEWVKGVIKTEVFAISKFNIQKHTLENDTFANGILKKVGLSFYSEDGKEVWKVAKRDFNKALRQKRCTCVTAMQTKAIGECDSAGAFSCMSNMRLWVSLFPFSRC